MRLILLEEVDIPLLTRDIVCIKCIPFDLAANFGFYRFKRRINQDDLLKCHIRKCQQLETGPLRSVLADLDPLSMHRAFS